MKEEILTIKEALAKAVDKLQQMEVPDADIDAWYLLSYVTGLDRRHFSCMERNRWRSRI